MRQTLHLIPADEFPLYIAARKRARAKAVLSIMAKCKITREEPDALTSKFLAFNAMNRAFWMSRRHRNFQTPGLRMKICKGMKRSFSFAHSLSRANT